MKKDIGWRLALISIVLLFSVWSLIPTIRVYSKSSDPHLPFQQREREVFKKANPNVASKALNLGLDLAGGTHIVVEIKKDQLPEDQRHDVVERSLEIIRNRVDQYGLSEPIITRSGENRIVADLAGLDAEDARRLIGATAVLEFKLVAEGEEFSPILNRVDNYLKRHPTILPKTGEVKGTAEEEAAAAGETDVFGRVVTDTVPQTALSAGDTSDAVAEAADTAAVQGDTTKVADADTAQDSALAAQDAEVFGARPFGSLLVGMGRDVGVRVADVPRVRAMLDHPEVRKLLPANNQFYWGREVHTLEDGTKVRTLYLLKRRSEMTGKYISDASYQRVQGGLQSGEVEVGLTFKGMGPKEFARITGANVGRQLAIVLDDMVYSAPVIQGRIPHGRASITGLKDMTEARQLAVTLRAGALPAPMEIAELRSVGPTLGEENIKKGQFAAIASLLLVVGFMVAYYRGAGVIANIALVFNMVIIFAVLSAFQATLTLPGIAGIVLTIGMAVDANVLIFERIREELRAGRGPRMAVDGGYRKAFSSIFDANITTLGTAAVLYYIGTGPIKGFGLTLMIGLAASMFTAIFVTRVVFDFFSNRNEGKSISLGNGVKFLHQVDLKVNTRSKIYVGISMVLVIAGLISILFHKGLNYGIDFRGGHVYQVQFQQAPDVERVKQEVALAGFGEPRVQTLGGIGTNELLVYLPSTPQDSLARAIVTQAVGENARIVSEDTVGPAIGNDLKRAAFWAIILSLGIIVFYIWLRFGRHGLGFGLAAVLAVAHDAFVTLGIFSIMGWEISLTFVAAALTIIGFSLNDTIVIFDRVRELLVTGSPKDSFAEKVNMANNQSFSRTIITSFTLFITVVVLASMGGAALRDFNVAMIIGVLAGTWSTIAIACPFLIWWQRRRTSTVAVAKK